MPKRERLDALEEKISARRQGQVPPEAQARVNANMLGLAYRLLVEILVGIGVGGFVGWWMDKVFDTKPIWMLVFLVLGMGAGLMKSVRTVNEMRRKQDQAEAAKRRENEE
jgi:ATP synthase protein I